MGKIFAGYIFIFFHLKINEWDILADFIGYILVYLGISRFSDDAGAFKRARPWTAAMAVVTFLLPFFPLIFPDFSVTAMYILNLLMIGVSLYILYRIDTGIGQLERKNGLLLMSDRLLTLWKVQVLLVAANWCFSWPAIDAFLLLAGFFAIAAAISNIVFLFFLYQVKKELDAGKAGGA